jgi:hypothetical protein
VSVNFDGEAHDCVFLTIVDPSGGIAVAHRGSLEIVQPLAL